MIWVSFLTWYLAGMAFAVVFPNVAIWLGPSTIMLYFVIAAEDLRRGRSRR